MQGDYYNQYNTELLPDERKGLYQWLMDTSLASGRNRFNDMNDYDMAGAYKQLALMSGGHMTDEFKKPNHPTFSNESIYNGVDGKYGGVWGENSFTPSQWNLQNMPAAQMQQYFAENESGVQLNLPADTGVLEMLMKGKL